MITYAAFLRGIMPTNPNTRSEKLREAFESLGFANVATVIASGNVVFDAPSVDIASLEKQIERALMARLGFGNAALVRCREDLEKLVRADPFKGVEDKKPNYLIVTFFKDRQKELCTVLDMTDARTPAFMHDIEKKHGKGVTTRTWKTVKRVLGKMDARS